MNAIESNLFIQNTPIDLNDAYIEKPRVNPHAAAAIAYQMGEAIDELKKRFVNPIAFNKANQDLAEVLQKYGNDKYHSALCAAINAKDLNAVSILLKNGFDPNEIPSIGYHPLIAAQTTRDIDIIKILLEFGSNPSTLFPTQGYEAYSCFHHAIVSYCLNGDSFSYELIDLFRTRHINLNNPVVMLKGQKYTPIQICLRLNLVYPAEKLTVDQKKRAAELATLLINNGARP